MKIAQKDAPARLTEARQILLNVEQQLERLGSERAAALVAADDQVIDRLDGELARLGRARLSRLDQIAALEAEVRRQRLEHMERERDAAVAAMAKRLEAQTALASEVEATAKKLAGLYVKLAADRATLRASWTLASPSYWPTSGGCGAELLGTLHQATSDGGHPLFPRQFWKGLNGLLRMAGVVTTVNVQNETLLALLRAGPIKLPVSDDDVEQEAA